MKINIKEKGYYMCKNLCNMMNGKKAAIEISETVRIVLVLIVLAILLLLFFYYLLPQAWSRFVAKLFMG